MATVKVTLSDLIDDGELDGYRRKAPRMHPWSEGIDAEVCAASECPYCHHKGLVWVPFTHAEVASYRAFGECPACGHCEEF